jgi:hypothetical protein
MRNWKQNREKHNAYQLKYYREHREKILRERREWTVKNREHHLNTRRAYHKKVAEKVRQQQKDRYARLKDDPAFKSRRAAEALRYTAKLRAEVLAAYGNKCTCCGESAEEFLSVDHIEGRGSHHRREVGSHMYHLLKKLSYPKDKYRLLCMNCNFSIGMRGYCPHDRQRQQEDNLKALWRQQVAAD